MTAVIDSTLENVQFKFASIIGELCGKPSVLSQFAVWLDLRLAEYKLKGSISLDCSGVKPDPLWLQGLRDSFLTKQSEAENVLQNSRQGKTNNTRDTTPSRSRTSHVMPNQTNQSFLAEHDRLSPEIVVVKEEPVDSGDIFPISLHLHDNQGASRTATTRDNRKRFSRGGDVPFHGFSSPKSRRMSPSASATSSPIITHDSSSSDQTIIATGYDLDNQSVSDSMLGLSETVDTGLEQIIRDSDSSYNPRGDNSADFHHNTSAIDDSELGMQSFRSGMQSFRSSEPGTSADTDRPIRVRSLPGQALKVGNVATLKKTYSSVKVLHTWLRGEPHREERRIEEVTPEELDNYLAEFFSVAKTRYGGEYHHLSFNALRSAIERYLQQQEYPCSIVKSTEFVKSQMSFKKRMHLLQQGSRSNPPTETGNVGLY